MKKIIVVAALAMMTSFASAQVKSTSSSFELNLGGNLSVFMQNKSTLALKDNQVKQIDVYRRRYEDDYNSWSRSKKHSAREIQYKRNEMIQNIRIEIENVLTINQREQWYSYDDRYDRKRYYSKNHKYDKKKHKHKKGKGHGHRHHYD